jgi:ketosteroid isomerase-like protein
VSARNEATIERFYDAFGRLDGAGMEACYAPDVHFRDPAFGDLHGPEAGAMWRMLTGNAKDLTIELVSRSATETSGKANWIATYTFRTGRKVRNDIQATFTFNAEGLIEDHVDEFDMWKWSRQALGPVGLIAGWTPVLKASVRRQARSQLERFMADESVAPTS